MWFWKRALTVVSIGFPVFLIVLLFLIPFLQSAMEYRAFLSHYNTEHTENWDKVAGTLPHFKSLGESGIDMTPKYFIKESMLQKIKSFFQSPSNWNLKTIKLWVIIALHRLSIKSSKSLENKGFIAMCSPYPFIWFHTSLLFPWLLIRAKSRARKSHNKI